MNPQNNDTDFSNAVARSMQIRKLYNELEKRKHGGPWTNSEDMIGLVHDVGELGRLVMAAEGRWIHEGELTQDLGGKLAECMWWILVLSDRLGIDINSAFSSKMVELESGLSASLEKTHPWAGGVEGTTSN